MKMKYDISEIKAEVLLNYLYPELSDKWTARMAGAFYRNYNQDAIDIYPDEATVSLSRDGFVKLLPQGLVTRDNDLKGEDSTAKLEELQARIHLLNEAFLPFDTYAFLKKVEMERQASEMLQKKLDFLLKEYFGFDLEQETNKLVRKVAVLLPYIGQLRGDFGFIRNLLKAIIHCDVEMTIGRYSHLDTTICWLPKVRYELLIGGLTPAQYRELRAQIEPLCNFIREWLVPFDVKCEILIKEHSAAKIISDRTTLDYNTELKL